MIDFFKNILKNKGFTIVELLVSLAIFSMILFVLISSFLATNASSIKLKSDIEASENARKTLDEMAYEIRSAESIYTPTTTTNQLSLETLRYTPVGENDTYIDFFLCGTAVCLRKDGQAPVSLTSDAVKVTNLTFLQILTGAVPSIQINMTASSGTGTNISLINLTSTASLRNY